MTNILAVSCPVAPGRGLAPYRIVLRSITKSNETKFATHRQYLYENDTTAFGCGNYFHVIQQEGLWDAYYRAYTDFLARSVEALGANSLADLSVVDRFIKAS